MPVPVPWRGGASTCRRDDVRAAAVPDKGGDGGHDDDSADEAGPGRNLIGAHPLPCDRQRQFQRVGHCVLDGGDQPAADDQKYQPQSCRTGQA
jgi:hypothetical protein